MEVVNDWYSSLIKDCKSIINSCEFSSRWALVEGYHSLGKRILTENDNFDRSKIYGGEIVARLRESLGKSEATIWRSVQFARKYPDIQPLKERGLSWHKVCVRLLPKTPSQDKNINSVSTPDITEAQDVVLVAAKLCDLLDGVTDSLVMKEDSKDYMCSQLRITAGKIGKFLINYDKQNDG